ncbi:MAG: MarR family transcriptional regulator [Caldiserica bacterium]|nr:MarR family transcriptional regulator [Caldisericota bacterium]
MVEKELVDQLVRLLEGLRGLGLEHNPLRDVGISPPQFALLDWVARHPGARLGEIAAGLGVTPPTVSVAVQRLEEAGLVIRRRDPGDRRVVRLFPTPRGAALHRKAEGFKRLRAEKLLAALAPAERAELVRLLAKAIHAVAGEREGPG